ncbi:hypothetical protein FB567DRAFT_560565 [Paraphoma chrysanthemicola]|uniref:Uncharacterized protein n=1 Tax=Paraphoma chrysanthemicola TaxID=798071 RepID=A0A8K0VZ37_9PLEO|nr:hypothetical protein FB567DRAFT_560565 [Paraphoma chrysanthemicola]
MCSQDTTTRKWYCCAPGVADSVCWNGATKCDGGDATTPSAQQIGCTSGTVKYCCLDKTLEDCTKIQGQFNICWSVQNNPLRPLNASRLNETFSSLSSASPTALSYTVDRQQLLALTSTTPGASSATPTINSTPASATASTSASATSSSSPSSNPSSDSGLSGGAIGGIVGGIIGGLALLGAIAFFIFRRRKSAAGKLDPHTPPGDPYQSYGYQPGYQPPPGQLPHEAPYSPQPGMAQMQSPQMAPNPLDKYAHHAGVHEAPAWQNPVEMDASYQQQQSGGGHYAPK